MSRPWGEPNSTKGQEPTGARRMAPLTARRFLYSGDRLERQFRRLWNPSHRRRREHALHQAILAIRAREYPTMACATFRMFLSALQQTMMATSFAMKLSIRPRRSSLQFAPTAITAVLTPSAE